MKRHLAIPLALGLAAALPAATIGADIVEPVSLQEVPSMLDTVEQGTTGYGCCWVYLLGRWYCFPCS